MRKCLELLILLIVVMKPARAQEKYLGVKDFLQAFANISTLPAYESGSLSAEVSTYDRTGGNNDGFAGTYSFIRRNADSSLVLFDIKGTGLINRIWTPTPTDDSLDFYIDDSSRISFTICYRDLFSGKIYPFVAPLCANQLGGFYCYQPIPFNRSCKIVCRGKFTRFHQIGYRLFPAGIKIKSFILPLDPEEMVVLDQIKSAWNQPSISLVNINASAKRCSTTSRDINIRPGEQVTIFKSRQPGRIDGFELLGELSEQAAKDIDLKISWDGEKYPAVYCPVADYFGYAFGKPSMRSLIIGSESGKNYSYFPMPFDQSARIELIYRKGGNQSIRPVSIRCSIFFSPERREVTKEGRFYANWNRENPVAFNKPFTMLDIQGRGHFVGTVLQARGLRPGMTSFFEGDDSTVVDGGLRMHGTGSEDFFNGGWYALLDCWDAAMSLPLSGALEYSLPLCRTGGYRLFLSDKVSFEKSFYQSIEHGPERNEVPADYTAVSFYYAGEAQRQRSTPTWENTRLFSSDTLIIYPQLMNMAVDGEVNVKTSWAFPTGGLTYYYTVTDQTILRMSLRDIPIGHYRLLLDYVKGPSGSSFSIWQRQTQLGGWTDGYDRATTRLDMQGLSNLDITALNNTISFRFRTAPGKDQFILNRIILVKK